MLGSRFLKDYLKKLPRKVSDISPRQEVSLCNIQLPTLAVQHPSVVVAGKHRHAEQWEV